jgi:hypothetical protein
VIAENMTDWRQNGIIPHIHIENKIQMLLFSLSEHTVVGTLKKE